MHRCECYLPQPRAGVPKIVSAVLGGWKGVESARVPGARHLSTHLGHTTWRLCMHGSSPRCRSGSGVSSANAPMPTSPMLGRRARGVEGGRLACVAYISLSLYTKAGAPGESCLAMHDGRVSTVTDMRRCREPRHGLSPSEVLMKGIQPPRCSGPGPCCTEELPSPCVRRILRNQQALQVLAPATSLQGLNPLCDFSVAHSSGPQPTRGRLEALIGSPPAGPPSPFAGPHTYNLPPCRAKHFYSQSP